MSIRLLSILSLLALVRPAMAQISRGNNLVSANFGFATGRYTTQYGSGKKEVESFSFLNLNGAYTHLISDRVGIGGELAVSWEKGDGYDTNVGGKALSDLSVVPFVRYYFYKSSKFFMYADGRLGVGTQTVSSAKINSRDSYYLMGGTLGFHYFINETIAWGVRSGTDILNYGDGISLPALDFSIGFTAAFGSKTP